LENLRSESYEGNGDTNTKGEFSEEEDGMNLDEDSNNDQSIEANEDSDDHLHYRQKVDIND